MWNKDNELIATFMGHVYYSENKMYSGWYIDNKLQRRICNWDGLDYHKNWNHLMKVIEKIQIICSENDEMEKFFLIKDEIPHIANTHIEIVKFIKNYNNGKKNL